jgi:ribosomal protein S18 acetylase RimI-like enzyme
MLRWAEQRLRAVAVHQPTRGNAVLATNASTSEREATALALVHGYRPVRYLSDMALRPLMRLPDTPLPAQLERRPMVPAHYHAIYQAWKDSWMGLVLTTAESEDDYRQFIDDNVNVPGFDPSLCQVAWSGGEVAGFVFCHIRRGVGIVPEVAVRPTWRRRGIARALLVRGLNALADRGISEVRIITNAENAHGARSLYESVGFRELKQHALYRKPMYRAQ